MKILIDGQTLATTDMGRGIGRVFMKLSEALVNRHPHMEWYIVVNNEADLQHVNADMANKLTVIVLKKKRYFSYQKRLSHFTKTLQQAIDDHGIQIYWHPNPLMTNVLFPEKLHRVAMMVTVHDVIPAMLPEHYVRKWPRKIAKEYQRRLADIACHADALFFVSQASQHDYARLYPCIKNKSHVAYNGVDTAIFHQKPTQCDKQTILYVGGFDYRKNMAGALEAFALLAKQTAAKYPDLHFQIVCPPAGRQATLFLQKAEQLGVGQKVELIHAVSDAGLSQLYANASLFFFPSLYEGFGLPVVEAMACGTLVVASDIAVLKEIGQDTMLYCSSTSPANMAQILHEALALSAAEKQAYLRRATTRADHFTWASSADVYSAWLA